MEQISKRENVEMFSTIQLSDLENNSILAAPSTSTTLHSKLPRPGSPINTSHAKQHGQDGCPSEATSADASAWSPSEGQKVPRQEEGGTEGPGNSFGSPANPPDGLSRMPFGTLVASPGAMNIHTGHMVYDSPTFNPYGQIQAHPGTMMASGAQIMPHKGQIMALNRPLIAPLGTMRDHTGQIMTPDGQIIVNPGQIRAHSGPTIAHPNTIVGPAGSYLATSGAIMAHHGQIVDPLGLVQTYSGPILASSAPMMIHPGQVMPHLGQVRAPPGSIITNTGLLMGPDGQILSTTGQILNQGPIMIPPGRIQAKSGFYFIQTQPQQNCMNPPNVVLDQGDGAQMMPLENVVMKPAHAPGQTVCNVSGVPDSNGSTSHIASVQKKRKERENELDTEKPNILHNKNKEGNKKMYRMNDSAVNHSQLSQARQLVMKRMKMTWTRWRRCWSSCWITCSHLI
ncbi:uncharacterized protein ACB058_003610 isoform 1-T1 [Synchiropus picturatus]